ncbi:energy transducer TonB [Qipengyuania sp. JC766]|uniref:energy transducer TonB n=1 Tax=Qipengyuania sp. JC766 TaxID=3232139 RepID=UPI00345AB2AB
MRAGLFLTILVAGLATAQPAHAQGEPHHTDKFGAPAGWISGGYDRSCYIERIGETDLPDLVLHSEPGLANQLILPLFDAAGEPSNADRFAIRIDGDTTPVQRSPLIASSVLHAVDDRLDRKLRTGTELTILGDGNVLRSISLKGSAAAMRAFDRCLAAVAEGPLPPTMPLLQTIPPPRMLAITPPPIATAPPMRLAAGYPAVPIDRESWITIDDYPASALRQLQEGPVGVSMQIDSLGRVEQCEIRSSSGYAQLDDWTCRILTRRATFDPATDDNGNPQAGSYATVVRWVLPPDILEEEDEEGEPTCGD